MYNRLSNYNYIYIYPHNFLHVIHPPASANELTPLPWAGRCRDMPRHGVMGGSIRAATALTAKACLILLKVTWEEQLLYQNNYHY